MESSTAITRVLSELQDVKRSGDKWKATCPAHDDTHPSLSISEGEDGKVLLTCHAGCLVKDIVDSIGLQMKDLFDNSRQRSAETAYRIEDASGSLIALHIRVDRHNRPKDFFWNRPDGSKTLGGLKTADLPLFGSELVSLAPADRPAIITEGEKAADSLRKMGILALGTVTGASGAPGKTPLKILLGRQVVLWPDNDEPGRKHMERVAKNLYEAGHRNLKILFWKQAPKKGDAADAVQSGLDSADLELLISEAKAWRPDSTDTDSDSQVETSPGRKKVGQATALVELAKKNSIELFHSPNRDTYFTSIQGEHCETYALNSELAKTWLTRLWYTTNRSTPKKQPLEDAFRVLAGEALFEGPSHDVYLRTAEFEGNIYINLADPEWQVVKVSAEGWCITKESPVRFIRPAGMAPLPPPQKGGNLRVLRPFVNLHGDDDWALFQSIMVSALVGRGPFPIAIFQGEQGSAKSTAMRIIRDLVDPNVAPIRAEPRNIQDLMIGANNAWIQAIDNVSRLPVWLSDGYCRLATGGGFSTRALFSNDSEKIFDAQRPVIINGIDEFGTRSDFLDRAVVFDLPPILDSSRRPELTFWRDFEQVKQKIFGALLDAVSCVLRNYGKTRIKNLPRMADFAELIVAAEPALDCEQNTVLAAYESNRRRAMATVLESSPLGSAIFKLVEHRDWKGTSTELLAALRRCTDADSTRSPGWPKASNTLSNKLSRLAHSFRASGVLIERDRSSATRAISIRKTKR